MSAQVTPAASAADQAVHGIRHVKKRAFLAAYAVTGNIASAAQAAGVHRTTHYDWLESDERYAVAFGQAHEVALDLLEQEARRRAVVGVREPYVHGGKVVTDSNGEPLIRTTYSDTLLIFLLNGGRPDKYRYRGTIDHQGPGGGAIPVAVEHRLAESVASFALDPGNVIDTTGEPLPLDLQEEA